MVIKRQTVGLAEMAGQAQRIIFNCEAVGDDEHLYCYYIRCLQLYAALCEGRASCVVSLALCLCVSNCLPGCVFASLSVSLSCYLSHSLHNSNGGLQVGTL